MAAAHYRVSVVNSNNSVLETPVENINTQFF